jgi:hypothetical protein
MLNIGLTRPTAARRKMSPHLRLVSAPATRLFIRCLLGRALHAIRDGKVETLAASSAIRPIFGTHGLLALRKRKTAHRAFSLCEHPPAGLFYRLQKLQNGPKNLRKPETRGPVRNPPLEVVVGTQEGFRQYPRMLRLSLRIRGVVTVPGVAASVTTKGISSPCFTVGGLQRRPGVDLLFLSDVDLRDLRLQQLADLGKRTHRGEVAPV